MERDAALPFVRPARLFIGGRFSDAEDGATGTVFDPARAAPLTTTALAGPADVGRAVAAARAAFPAWRAVDARDRGRLLRRLAALLKEDADAFAALEALNGGKPFALARAEDVASAVEAFEGAAALAERLDGSAVRTAGGGLAATAREPLGVVAVFAPTHGALPLLARRIAAALVAGNTVVAKVPALAPLAADRLGSLVEEAGWPPGVVNLLPGLGLVAGRALADHPDAAVAAFAGSAAAGRDVAARAGAGLKRVGLELLGRATQIVFDEPGDLKALAAAVVDSFAGSGGAAGARILVERSLYDRFVPRLVEAANLRKPRCPFDRRADFRPLPSAERVDAVRAAVEDAVRRGARAVAGGEPFPAEEGLGGWYFRATVLVDVPPDAAIATDGVSGPVATVAPFADEDDAVRLANAAGRSPLAAVRTRDLGRAHRTAARLDADGVLIGGDGAAPGEAVGPRFEALDLYCRSKTTWVLPSTR